MGKSIEWLETETKSEGSNLFKQGRIELALERYKKAEDGKGGEDFKCASGQLDLWGVITV